MLPCGEAHLYKRRALNIHCHPSKHSWTIPAKYTVALLLLFSLPTNVIHVMFVSLTTPEVTTVRFVVILANRSLILLK